MIVGNRSSLGVYSDGRTVAEISELLGLQPGRSADRGDLTTAGRAGRRLAPDRLVHQRASWSFSVEDAADADEDAQLDETGFGSLRALVAVLLPKAPQLAKLRRDGETILWWSGDSDSEQGGFVMPADLLADLGTLGCDLYGTAYLVEDEE